MINISNSVQKYLPLCVGIALLGYLGYRLISWIMNKSQGTEKIDHVSQENFNHQQPSSPKSLINKVSDLEISPDTITMGQGEYIVFHKLPTGERQPLSPETFEKAYQVLLQHSPAALINSRSEKAI